MFARTLGALLMTRETVFCETPARRATSVITGLAAERSASNAMAPPPIDCADADRRDAAEDVRDQRDGDGTGEHHTVDAVVNEPVDGPPELLTRCLLYTS